jgi:sortase A
VPIGGDGARSVLTGHSGLVHATLFTRLDQARKGDRFTITVLDQVLTYEVDQIRVVLPSETGDLVAVPGEDLVTLVTCTPTGVNTHRLLVRGHRVPTPGVAAGTSVISGRRPDAFPWWLVGAGIASVATVVGTSPLARRRRPRRRALRSAR